ncbi:MAG: hypothetical protein GXW89_10565 [Phycisphaerae bacterium]|nr:hypothetical protein [Phycisphaerae bacterium]
MAVGVAGAAGALEIVAAGAGAAAATRTAVVTEVRTTAVTSIGTGGVTAIRIAALIAIRMIVAAETAAGMLVETVIVAATPAGTPIGPAVGTGTMIETWTGTMAGAPAGTTAIPRTVIPGTIREAIAVTTGATPTTRRIAAVPAIRISVAETPERDPAAGCAGDVGG